MGGSAYLEATVPELELGSGVVEHVKEDERPFEETVARVCCARKSEYNKGGETTGRLTAGDAVHLVLDEEIYHGDEGEPESARAAAGLYYIYEAKEGHALLTMKQSRSYNTPKRTRGLESRENYNAPF